jgi:hypothetical protein
VNRDKGNQKRKKYLVGVKSINRNESEHK